MKVSRGVEDAGYSVFFILMVVGIYVGQQELVKVCFDAAVNTYDACSGWIHSL